MNTAVDLSRLLLEIDLLVREKMIYWRMDRNWCKHWAEA